MSELTCEEVNRAIARLRGVPQIPTWSAGYVEADIDYCHDWAVAGPLLEEMYAARGCKIWVRADVGARLTESTARAYYAWKQGAA